MPHPALIPVAVVAGLGLAGSAVVMRLRAINAAKLGTNGNLPPAPGSAAPTAATKATVAAIPSLPPVIKQPDGTVSAAELARQLAAEKIRAAQLTTDQLRAIEANAIPGKNVAEFDGNGTAGAPVLPLGTFKAGDILPSDHVSINIKAAGLNFLPRDVTGDLLIRCTAMNTDNIVRGVSIDPRFVEGERERDYPMAAVTGVGPVAF